MIKADDVRCFAEAIAQWRVDGLTWAQIAAKLGDEDIRVSTDEIRSYWPRLSEGRSPAEYLLFWQSSQRNAEVREARRQLEHAEAEIADLRQQILAWEQDMRSTLVSDQQNEALRQQLEQTQALLAASQRSQSELERSLDEARHYERDAAGQVRQLRQQIDVVTEHAIAAQRDVAAADRRAQAAYAEISQLRQQVSELQQNLAQAEEVRKLHGNIRYLQGVGEGQVQLEAANKDIDGWVAYGKALAQAHQARNRAEITQLLDHIVGWAMSRGQG